MIVIIIVHACVTLVHMHATCMQLYVRIPRLNACFVSAASTIGTFLLAQSLGYPHMEHMAYIAASLCCIGGISGLASQKSAPFGNALGMIGVGTGVATAVASMNVPAVTLATAGALMATGLTNQH